MVFKPCLVARQTLTSQHPIQNQPTLNDKSHWVDSSNFTFWGRQFFLVSMETPSFLYLEHQMELGFKETYPLVI